MLTFRGCPIFSALFGIAVLWILGSYLRHCAAFAKNDPDRLQSEEYRYATAQMEMIAAKELRSPTPAEDLSLEDPRENWTAPRSSSEEDRPPASTDVDEEKTS